MRTVEDPERTRRTPSFIHHPPSLARHRRKCQICHHPDRELIEDLFIHWHSPNSIANFINSASDDDDDPSLNENNITWVAIYRHAYALGLDEVRRRNLRFAFELILEQAGDITPTSASIMAAARAYAACVNTDGQWNDPPKRVIVTNIARRESDFPDSGLPVEAFVGAPLAAPVSGAARHSSSSVEFAGAPSGVHSGSFAGAPFAQGGSANDSAGPGFVGRGFSSTEANGALAPEERLTAPNVVHPPVSLGDASTSCPHRSVPNVIPPAPPSFVGRGFNRDIPSAEANGALAPEERFIAPNVILPAPLALTQEGRNEGNPAAPFADGGEGPAVAFASTPSTDSPAQEPSTHCHSERGCDQHPTRNLHFSGFDQASTGEIRNSANLLKHKENTFSNR